MTLYVHRAERADRLAAELAEVLAVPPEDVFAEEVVAVPARGVERWITQRLSHRLGRQDDREDGVCAGVRFPSPVALVAEVVGVEEHDPWAPDSLVWPLLEVIDAHAGEEWCRTLGAHLGVDSSRDGGAAHDGSRDDRRHRRGRRYAVARRLAGLFDSYALHRPGMLAAWATGEDSDGFGSSLPPDLAWQAQLWRLVRELIGGPDPVQRLARALDRLRQDPASVPLPDRLSLFGATRLATSQLAVMAALAEARDVHLWLPHPSPELWQRIADLSPTGPVRRRLDPTITAPEHPLLSSLGRDSRELALTLSARNWWTVDGSAANWWTVVGSEPTKPTTVQQLRAGGGTVQQSRGSLAAYVDTHHPLDGGSAASAGAPIGQFQLPGDPLGPREVTNRRSPVAGPGQGQPVAGSGQGQPVAGPAQGQPVAGPGRGQPAEPAAERPTSLLKLLQRDIRDDRRPDAGANPRLRADDRSIQVHACHGSARQVDVLREVLVGLLAADPSLEPRDMLVMCPDIEVYAPLISAAFGLAEVVTDGHPAHELRVRLADRALTQTNPLLATVARLLDLADARVTASQVLDLAAWPPVRRRFQFDDEDLETLGGWVAQAGVRWGIDAEHRRSYGLDRFPQNTWRAGLDRILLGAAMADEDQNWLGLALPLDDIGSGDVALVGRLAELLDRLQAALDSLVGEASLGTWLDALAAGAESLTSVSAADAWQTAELHRELETVSEGAAERSGTTTLGLSDLRALLAGRLGGRPTRANFRTGTLTVCTMVPMRSVPHRVICLLGLDDGVFPRGAHIDGDDVLARDPAVGERDPRGEDRQLMLDALLAATEHVVITYTGADERTGALRPPAVPLGELLDALDDTARTAEGAPARDQVLVRHPLQPFDARNVTPGALGTPRSFSFDASALAGARAAAGTRVPPPPFLTDPLPPPAPTTVELGQLTALLHRPAREFLRQRLDIALRYEEREPSGSLAVELDNLEQWSIGDRLLQARLAGADEDSCYQAEWRRGVLPPGTLGRQTLSAVLSEVDPLVARTQDLRALERSTVDVIVPLGDGRELRGTVPGVHGTCLASIGYSKLAAGARLRAWVNLVALAAAYPETPWTAITVGRGTSAPKQSTLGPLDHDVAHGVLSQLVDLYERGLREPLPMAVKTSAAYAAARRDGNDQFYAVRKAGYAWASGNFPGEDAEPANLQVWGSGRPAALQRLLGSAPNPDERWVADEPTRFGQLAMRLWSPLLDSEQVSLL